jgi:hypothetical protein
VVQKVQYCSERKSVPLFLLATSRIAQQAMSKEQKLSTKLITYNIQRKTNRIAKAENIKFKKVTENKNQ